jgi:hypothetical protein
MPRKREKGDGLNFPCLEENMSKKIALLTPHCPINIDSGPNCKCNKYFNINKEKLQYFYFLQKI